ncbi:ABC transporter substrate-binding protein [Pasteurella canis]|uniref:Hemin ABC transporter substrate-binding protein n=1 Tax=Pasteurella canis TaxID=753 RepID=A0ABQ4VHL8_9PAST|nr:ABC transporter substrate-binding protein [Pasteurella canis]MXN87917.1 ABC transporter substrate-binding protein [Pasteurella canis]UEA17737.1 ABC transporter substrate-binding protein [Pasteurella canis]UEC24157.1 ABC transporter substrate-binding protein [Pasteurella canis]GJH42835.1 hemin ABC transporter substrate-binding protein [Pasteurella canis]
MKKIITLCLLLAIQPFAYGQRIVALTPDTADIIVALESAEQLVGRDQTSMNPAIKQVASIGIHRKLTIEPILETKPDLVLGSYMAMPVTIFDSLNQLGVKTVNVLPRDHIEEFSQAIREVGKLIAKSEQADKLAKTWDNGIQPLPHTGKRYLLTYDGRVVAGKNTAADELIRRAGGVNAAVDVEGIKPLNREAWLVAQPDIIIVAEHQKDVIGGIEKLLERPEIANSPAAKSGNIHFWSANDYLRYGLNTPEVLQRLHKLAK